MSLLRVTTYGSPIFCSKCYHPTSTSTAGGPRSFYCRSSIYNPFIGIQPLILLHYCCPSSGFHLLRWWVHTFNAITIISHKADERPSLEKQGMPLFTHFRLARPLDTDTGHLCWMPEKSPVETGQVSTPVKPLLSRLATCIPSGSTPSTLALHIYTYARRIGSARSTTTRRKQFYCCLLRHTAHLY